MLKINRSSVKREKIIDIGLRINLLKMSISVYCRQNNLKDVNNYYLQNNFFLKKSSIKKTVFPMVAASPKSEIFTISLLVSSIFLKKEDY